MKDFVVGNTNILISKTPLVNKYITEVKSFPILTPDEEVELVKLAQNGDIIARDKLINSNLRFVISVAKSYANDKNLPDLINEGNIGLIESISCFDHKTGFKLISFSVWHIRKRILGYLSKKNKLIRLPENKSRFIRNTSAIERKLSHELERTPSIDEIIEEYNRDESILRKEKASIDSLTKARVINDGHSDLFSGPMENTKLIDTIDGSMNSPDDNITKESSNTLLMEYINDLNDRDRDIIIRRHGLAGEREMTFMEIGKIYDRSSESIRQRYHSVIMSLRFNMTKQTKGKADINSVSQFF
tara:strand:+ start:5543 stop:6448 length:906 start_codon:yes stop_codon:yes gene_type:complete